MSTKATSLPSDSPPVISVEGLRGEIKEGTGLRRLFEPVSFRLQPRRLLVITGRNGVGKTSLLRLLAGSETPVEFEGSAVTTDGSVPIDHLHTLYRAWFVEAGHEVFPTLTVRENLEVVLLTSRNHWDSAIGSLIEKWKIAEMLDRPAVHLSGGELRRVQILMAVLSRANAILLDEPLAGLDDAGIDIFHDILKELLNNDVIAVLTEHHIDSMDDLEIEHLELLEPPSTRRWPESLSRRARA